MGRCIEFKHARFEQLMLTLNSGEVDFVMNGLEITRKNLKFARLHRSFFIFFFQAEDGIRDVAVTGVQTCALPISTSVTALIATGSKAAAFAALIRVLTVAFRGAQPDWTALLWIVAALTMTVGNVAAIAQSNLKRMLAYSSIAHAGYMLVGLVAGGMSGAGAVLFYLRSEERRVGKEGRSRWSPNH